MKLPKLLAALALLAAPALAFAHPGHGEHGLVAGLAHPLTGLDHLLAMFAVGLWAAQQQGAARLALPCTFVGTMLVGGLLGFEGLQLPFMETGIAASVLALGLCVALAVRPPLALWRSGPFGGQANPYVVRRENAVWVDGQLTGNGLAP
ncbi:HupE/UreJ family protein, partial [Pseudomonas aeruginosa]|uniref:HupE/UreJ family protein n=1 Tax=Pseudomonas aeruginosa TaxID=287 RepID=UPI0023B0C0D6